MLLKSFNTCSNFIKLARPYQWIKNLFCLSGLVFGFHFNEINVVFASVLVFISFCFAASAVYVLNDIFDADEDRQHPLKKNRPIACGAVSKFHAKIFYVFLVVLSVILALCVSKIALIIILIYIIINIFYSIYAKHIVLLDVFLISFGFVLRVLAGTYAIGIIPTDWLLLCVIAFTLFLGFAKRRAELMQVKNSSEVVSKRKVLTFYKPKVLDMFLVIMATLSIIAYALFVVVEKHVPWLILTVFLVIYGILRYIMLLYSQIGIGQDMSNDLLDDKQLVFVLLLWIFTYLAICFVLH